MKRLLVIADDFTGALDTGVQFAARGAVTTVVTNSAYDFHDSKETIQVLVMDAETRHLSPKQAYDVVYHIVRTALDAGITHIYKKTDSALRGNIGSELTAVMDAAGANQLAFAPAFPKTKRTTRQGIHYIGDVPVAESVFGQDPFEPVRYSSVAEIITSQSPVPTVLHPVGEQAESESPGIHVFDASSDEDLHQIGAALTEDQCRFCAGCAGFAAVMADVLGIRGEPPEMPSLKKALFIACGSVNPVTLQQMQLAGDAGFPHVHLRPHHKLDPAWICTAEAEEEIHRWLETAAQEQLFILDVNDPADCDDTNIYAALHQLSVDEMRVRISQNLARIMKKILDEGLDATMLCTGGDTLLAVMRQVGVSELTPVCEVTTGVVLTYFVYHNKIHYIFSKSGGFGAADLFCKLATLIDANNRRNVLC